MPADRPLRPRIRRLAARLVRGVLVAGIAVPSGAAHAEPPGRCVAVRVPTDSQDVSCPLDPSMIGRPLRFVAEFAGSHDDTRLALAATLDGEPLACDIGSKTTLFAEDGIVHLDCRFRGTGKPGVGAPAPVLRVALTVHHAQYVDASLAVESR